MRILACAAFAASLTACSTGVTLSSGVRSGAIIRTTAPALTASASVSVTLSTDQAAAVRAYYGQSSSGRGHDRGRGRGRNGSLPPGIARNLERGKALPPGIAKQALPQQLAVTLPRPADGLEYLVVAGKLLLVETATQIVHQVLLDSVFG
jgi:hypothetical protein